MPQITSLSGADRSKGHIISLDSRKQEQVVSDKQYLKILQLSDLLSRHLVAESVLSVFSAEINSLVNHDSYSYTSDSYSVVVKQGEVRQHSLQYHLTIQQFDLGHLTLYRDQPFSSNEMLQLEELLCSLVYPLRNALLYQSALRSAYRDPLTEINNRLAMEMLLPREIHLAKRHDQKLALMIMDLDGFKEVNDQCGHDAGDRLLRLVSARMQSVLRSTDMLFRYGGDEFVTALPQTEIQGAIDVAQRILEAVPDVRLEDESQQHCTVGVSIGISMLHSGDDFNSLFKRVDEAMYRAKQSGKHRIIVQ